MIGRLDLLELYHPDGVSRRSVVLGGGCPASLLPAPGASDAPADLVVLAPTRRELGRRRWLADMVRVGAEALAPDGICYAMVPPRARPRVARLFRRAGLVLGPAVLHAPSWAASHHLVPLAPAVTRYATEMLVPLQPRRRRLALAALTVPGALGMLRRLHPGVGLIGRRPGARPLFEWLFRAHGATPDGTAVVRAKWRGGRGAVVLHALTSAGEPSAVAKITLTAFSQDERAEREVARLAHLGASARAAGATVPAARLHCHAGAPMVLESAVPGERAAALLGRRQIELPGLVEGLAAWLESWHAATRAEHVLDRALLQREVLGPAERIAPLLPRGSAYLAWLHGCCRPLFGRSVPLVAVHADLTMSNVLVDSEGHLGVVDWESAATAGLPLRDFWYGVVDALAATRRDRNRVRAFLRCFAAGGALAELVAGMEERLRAAIGMSDDFATLAFHACWLQHAADEQRKRRRTEARPFLQIVQWLAAHPTRYGGPVGKAAA